MPPSTNKFEILSSGDDEPLVPSTIPASSGAIRVIHAARQQSAHSASVVRRRSQGLEPFWLKAMSVQDGIAHACSSVLWLVCIGEPRQFMGRNRNGFSKTIFSEAVADNFQGSTSARRVVASCCQEQFSHILVAADVVHRRSGKARDRVQARSPRSERKSPCL